VFNLQRIARHKPNWLASDLVDADELAIMQMTVHEIQRDQPIRPSPAQTAVEFMVNLGRIAGFQPTKRQPLPGTKILWRAHTRLMIMTQAIRDYKDTWMLKPTAIKPPSQV